MNEDIEQKLMTYLSYLEETATNGIDFAKEQLPLYCQELLAWEFWVHFMGMSFLLFLFISIVSMLCTICYKLKDRMKHETWEDDTPPMARLSGVICSVLLILSIVGFTPRIYRSFEKVVKVKVAPRVVLVEKISSLLER